MVLKALRCTILNDSLGPGLGLFQLLVAVGINCFGARLYGRVEFWFAMVRYDATLFLVLLTP